MEPENSPAKMNHTLSLKVDRD